MCIHALSSLEYCFRFGDSAIYETACHRVDGGQLRGHERFHHCCQYAAGSLGETSLGIWAARRGIGFELRERALACSFGQFKFQNVFVTEYQSTHAKRLLAQARWLPSASTIAACRSRMRRLLNLGAWRSALAPYLARLRLPLMQSIRLTAFQTRPYPACPQNRRQIWT